MAALGLLVFRMHACNTFRERSDDLAVNAQLLENLTGTLAECVKFAQALPPPLVQAKSLQ